MDQSKYKAALVARHLTQKQVAKLIGCAPSTLSGYVIGTHARPPGFQALVEKALGLPKGALEIDAVAPCPIRSESGDSQVSR